MKLPWIQRDPALADEPAHCIDYCFKPPGISELPFGDAVYSLYGHVVVAEDLEANLTVGVKRLRYAR